MSSLYPITRERLRYHGVFRQGKRGKASPPTLYQAVFFQEPIQSKLAPDSSIPPRQSFDEQSGFFVYLVDLIHLVSLFNQKPRQTRQTKQRSSYADGFFQHPANLQLQSATIIEYVTLPCRSKTVFNTTRCHEKIPANGLPFVSLPRLP
jgi:hypothetical protein